MSEFLDEEEGEEEEYWPEPDICDVCGYEDPYCELCGYHGHDCPGDREASDD